MSPCAATEPLCHNRRMTNPDHLTITEVAGILGVSRQRASQLRDAGELPAPVDTTSYAQRWDRSAIESFAESRRSSPRRVRGPAKAPA